MLLSIAIISSAFIPAIAMSLPAIKLAEVLLSVLCMSCVMVNLICQGARGSFNLRDCFSSICAYLSTLWHSRDIVYDISIPPSTPFAEVSEYDYIIFSENCHTKTLTFFEYTNEDNNTEIVTDLYNMVPSAPHHYTPI
jgi:hypothetical protein